MLLFLQFIRTLHRWISYITKPIGFYFWHIHSQEWTMSRIVGADKTVVLKQLEKPHANVRCKWWLCPSARQYVSRGCLLHFDSYYLYYVSVKRDRLTVYIYILWPLCLGSIHPDSKAKLSLVEMLLCLYRNRVVSTQCTALFCY